MFSQIVFWCILLYIPVCVIKKFIEVQGKTLGMFMCHMSGLNTDRLMREIIELEKRPFYKLWGK